MQWNKSNIKTTPSCHQLNIRKSATSNKHTLDQGLHCLNTRKFSCAYAFLGDKEKMLLAFFFQKVIRIKQNPTELGTWLYSISSG